MTDSQLKNLVITEDKFLTWARQWRLLRLHRVTLHKATQQYPLSMTINESHVWLESPADVDRLILDLRGKLKALWEKK